MGGIGGAARIEMVDEEDGGGERGGAEGLAGEVGVGGGEGGEFGGVCEGGDVGEGGGGEEGCCEEEEEEEGEVEHAV